VPHHCLNLACTANPKLAESRKSGSRTPAARLPAAIAALGKTAGRSGPHWGHVCGNIVDSRPRHLTLGFHNSGYAVRYDNKHRKNTHSQGNYSDVYWRLTTDVVLYARTLGLADSP
jgi:hypothetical protein